MNAALNVLKCHACASHDGDDCLEDGRSIRDHAEASRCPLRRFGTAEPLESRGPGDAVALAFARTRINRIVKAIARLTGRKCRCGARRDWLNRMLLAIRVGQIRAAAQTNPSESSRFARRAPARLDK
jgi:hypothetical protein